MSLHIETSIPMAALFMKTRPIDIKFYIEWDSAFNDSNLE